MRHDERSSYFPWRNYCCKLRCRRGRPQAELNNFAFVDPPPPAGSNCCFWGCSRFFYLCPHREFCCSCPSSRVTRSRSNSHEPRCIRLIYKSTTGNFPVTQKARRKRMLRGVSRSLRRASTSTARRTPSARDTARTARRITCRASVNSDAAASICAIMDPRAESLRRQRMRPVLSTPWTSGLRGMSTASAQEEEVRVVPRVYLVALGVSHVLFRDGRLVFGIDSCFWF